MHSFSKEWTPPPKPNYDEVTPEQAKLGWTPEKWFRYRKERERQTSETISARMEERLRGNTRQTQTLSDYSVFQHR